jgi:hypothetical protein
VVERFFSTEIHTVHQGKYGERYTNVKPVSAPAGISSMVRDISVNNLVVVRTRVDQETSATQRHSPRVVDALGREHIDVPAIRPLDSSVRTGLVELQRAQQRREHQHEADLR